MDGSADSPVQRQLDDLVGQVASALDGIRALEDRADVSHARADAAQARADVAHERADAADASSQVDREMLAELQAEGILSQKRSAEMDQALLSSRVIGAAVGILMASRQVSQDQAFTLLKEASQRSNRKLRDIATELVETTNRGDLV